MTNDEIDLAENILLNKLNLSKAMIFDNDKYENINKNVKYLVELGNDIEAEMDEWCEYSQHKNVFFRIFLFNKKTQKTFLDMVINLSITDKVLNKKYFTHCVPEYDKNSLDNDNLSDSENNNYMTLSQKNDLQELTQKEFWNVIKYLIYHDVVLNHFITVE